MMTVLDCSIHPCPGPGVALPKALKKGVPMSIDSESDIAANLQIGPTDRGMVRIYVESEAISLPLDFEPEEAEEIAEELRAAAARARLKG